MFQIISTAATYLFPGGRALKLVKGGVNITNFNKEYYFNNFRLFVTIGSAVHLVTEIYEMNWS